MNHSPEPPLTTPNPSKEEIQARNDLARALAYQEALDKIGQKALQRRQLPATAKQEDLLRKHGRWRAGMKRGEAADRIRELPKRGRK